MAIPSYSPEAIDAQLAELQQRGIVQRPAPPPSGGPLQMQGVDPATAAMALSREPPRAPPMSHDAPAAPISPTGPGNDLHGYINTLRPVERQATSVAVNDENPEVALAHARQAMAQQTPQLQAPRYVAPHFDDRNVPIKPGTRKEILGTFDTIAKAQSLEARAKADEATVVADRMGAEADRARQSMAGRMAAEDERRQATRQQVQRLQEATDAARGGRINENQVWEQKGAVGRLFAGIGIALGAGLQAQRGGSNPALDIINSEIARNLDAQKANLAAAHNDVLRQDNLLGKYREMFGDERLAEIAFENTAREVAIQGIQAEAAKRQAPQIQANAAAAIGKLRQEQLAAQADFEKMAFVRGQMVGGGGAAAAVKQDANIVRLPDGRVVRFPTEKEAIAAREKLTAAYNTVDMYDQAGRLRKKLADINPVTSLLEWANTRAELNALSERILPEWSLSHGQGQVKEEEARRYKENLFPFSANTLFNSERADRILQQGRDKELSQIDNIVRGSAGEFVDTGYALDAKGNVQQDVELRGQAAPGKRIAAPSGFKPFGGGGR